MADIFEGGSELDRVLRGTFKSVSRDEAEQILRGLGDYDTASVVPTEGKVPGITYQGGPQSAGGQGAVARKVQRKIDALFAGVDRSKCPPWLTEDCCDVLSRCLEQTLRNFQLTARRPSHIDPPFSARPIDVFPAGVVTVPGAPYGGPASFVNVTCFTVPAYSFRAEIESLGQSAESTAAFSDLEWRVTVDGLPLSPWNSILIQLWAMVPPTKICSPIHLVSKQTICIQARSLSMADHKVLSRICGWYYPVRSETGPEIRSTLVD